MERFLHRLSMSQHLERFILKGALMLRVWRSPDIRPTMDIDMPGMTSNSEAGIVAFFESFVTEKQVQWAAFRKRIQQEDVPVEFGAVASVVRDFLAPVAMALISRALFILKWNAPGPWVVL